MFSMIWVDNVVYGMLRGGYLYRDDSMNVDLGKDNKLAKLSGGLGLGLGLNAPSSKPTNDYREVVANDDVGDALTSRITAKLSPKMVGGTWREFGFDTRPLGLPNPSSVPMPQLPMENWELKRKPVKGVFEKEKMSDLHVDKQGEDILSMDGYLADLKRQQSNEMKRRAFTTAWAQTLDLLRRNTDAQGRCTLDIEREGVQASKTLHMLATSLLRARRLGPDPSRTMLGPPLMSSNETGYSTDLTDTTSTPLFANTTQPSVKVPRTKTKKPRAKPVRKPSKSSAPNKSKKPVALPAGSFKTKRHKIMEGFQAAGLERQVQQLLRIYYEIDKFKELYDGNKAASKTDLPDDSDRQFYSKRLKPFLRCYFDCCKGNLNEFKKRNLNMPNDEKPRLVFSRKDQNMIIFRLRNWTGNCACRVASK